MNNRVPVFGEDREDDLHGCLHTEALREYVMDRVAVCVCGQPREEHQRVGTGPRSWRRGIGNACHRSYSGASVYRFCHWRAPS